MGSNQAPHSFFASIHPAHLQNGCASDIQVSKKAIRKLRYYLAPSDSRGFSLEMPDAIALSTMPPRTLKLPFT